MRASSWLSLAGTIGAATLIVASCHDEPGHALAGARDGASEDVLSPPFDAGVSGPSALCRTDRDCPITERCCSAGLLGLCSPLAPGRRCAEPDLTLSLPPDFAPRVEHRLFDEGNCLLEKCVSGPGARRLLRFPLNVVNRGHAPMILAQSDAPGVRRIACDGSIFVDDFLRYELIDAQGARRAGGVGSVALACRVGILAAPTSPFDCETLGLEAQSYREFFSEDDCQWVDITTLPPGQYTLRLSVNPDSRLREASFDNNVVERPVTIPEADPLAPCDPNDIPRDVGFGDNIECGWEPMPDQTGLLCEPGELVELACTYCDGAYLPRPCPGTAPCSAAGSLRLNGMAWLPEVCDATDTCDESGQCTQFDFQCPASGVYSLLGFPSSPLTFAEAPISAPRRVICRPSDGEAPIEVQRVPGPGSELP